MRPRPATPAGHGELLVQPSFDGWASLAESNRRDASAWRFSVAGMDATDLRTCARAESFANAEDYSSRLGITMRQLGDPQALIVMTGHQPELFHPGVWAKDFLLQRLADQIGASALDVVVDSDGFDRVAITAPCLTPEPRRCTQYLALGSQAGCYWTAPVPSESDIDDFCRSADEMLATLPAPSIRRHFSEFCGGLKQARPRARNLAEVVTATRRLYEASAGTDYAELSISELVRGRAFSAFAADLATNAERFAEAYNGELSEYRVMTNTRSIAQPFPDLDVSERGVELPLWVLADGFRRRVWARRDAEGVTLATLEGDAIQLPLEGAAAADALARASVHLAPKALALTLFLRMFCCDLFIHGVGGGRYDRVTDGVCRRYYGVEPPAFVVASLTMYLPLGAHVVSDEEVADARQRLNRLAHNPDALLGEVDFDDAEERMLAVGLAERKRELVEAMKQDGADKKSLGVQIRAVNAELAALLAPVRERFEEALRALEQQQDASGVLTDRTYPFCFWSPWEVADKVR